MSAHRSAAAAARAAASDAELVVRVLNGDREGYSILVRRHQDALFRHARGMGLDADTAEDLVQDAFVKAYVSLAECRDPARFRAWVFRILRNGCLDHARDIRRRTVSLEDVPGGADASATAAADRAELRLVIGRALDTLPAALRDAFLLKHQAGYTYEEMADIAGCSVSAMKMRVHRARDALMTYLAPEDATAP